MKTQRLLTPGFVALLNLLGIVGFAFPKAGFAGNDDLLPTISVEIDNYSNASPSMLAGAEQEAGRILGEAGLRAIWTECPVGTYMPDPQTPCQKATESTDLRLRILTAPVQQIFKDEVVGFTVHPVLASVYYEYVVRLAKREDFELQIPVILGCVIAHELGHLLLGPNGHSQGGIMQGQWKTKQLHLALMGGLVFTSQQSKILRMAARTRSARQNPASSSSAP